jgi:cytochrome bd ubiquinol oxidase subunit II
MDGQTGIAAVWYWILALLLYLYLLTDGFDLGVGILCLTTADETVREVMTETIEGVWHANQTWLVMLGGVLFGAYPLVYGTVLAALYLPAGLLLFAFMARGIGLECRAEADNPRPWTLVFGLGSLAVIVAHGLLLGGILQGMRFANGVFQGGPFDWLSPFTVLVCAVLLTLYTLFGAAWLALRTDGSARDFARLWGVRAAGASLVLLVLLVTYIALTPALGHLAGRPGTGGLSPLFTVLVLLAGLNLGLCARALGKGWDRRPLLHAAALLLLLALAFGTSLFPVLVPPGLTVAQAASPPDMLRIMLWVVGGLLPVVLLYNAYQYRVFAGKVSPDGETDAS